LLIGILADEMNQKKEKSISMQLLSLILFLTYKICIVSSLHSIHKYGVTPVQSLQRNEAKYQVRSTHRKTSTIRYERRRRSGTITTLQMGYKSPDEQNNYNDDAFGLVFLASAFDGHVDFAGTFLVLSAIGAISTSSGILEKDDRLPGVVACITLLLSPIVSSLRLTRSFDNISLPTTVEFGLVTISVLWSFINWKQQEESIR